MTTFLEAFYERISAQAGISLADFKNELDRLKARPRSDDDLNAQRLSRQGWKKLKDEVMPVSRFLRSRGIGSGRIRFPLDDQPPDCWLWEHRGATPCGIEVTIAQATERYHLNKELVETGQGRGFIGLPDNAPRSDFDRVMSNPHEMYSTEQALKAIRGSILDRLAAKDRQRFAGFDLLIQAPLSILPRERWDEIKSDLAAAAVPLPFREIIVISDGDDEPWGFSIK